MTTPPPSVLTNFDPALRSAWHPVLRLSDLDGEPVAVRLLGEEWVVVRLDGKVRAFADRCPHRLAPLSIGRVDRAGGAEVLRCGYHGWCFEASGACTEIPALGPGASLPPRARATSAAGVAAHLGLVWIAPEAPRAPLPDAPVAEDDLGAFLVGDLPALHPTASAGLLVDNFLDVAHFPFVHAATIGDEGSTQVGDIDVVRDGPHLTVRSAQRFPNREDPGVAAGIRPLLQTRHVTYRYTAPFAAWLRIDYAEAGGTNVITFFVQPVDADHCTIYSSTVRNDLHGDVDRLASAVEFEHAIVAEDLMVQEAFAHRSIPLDLTMEVHTRADRMTVEYRRILKDFVADAALTALPVVPMARPA